jgi:hypothetical protein
MIIIVKSGFWIKGDNARMLRRIYGSKLSKLLEHLRSEPLKRQDYADLKSLRQHITAKTKIVEIADKLVFIKSEKTRNMILGISPLFDICPSDLKCYILLCAGVRSEHFEGKERVND